MICLLQNNSNHTLMLDHEVFVVELKACNSVVFLQLLCQHPSQSC